MRKRVWGVGLCLVAGTGVAQADSGGFFKNLFNGGGGSGSSAPIGAPMRAYDPNEAYCPAVTIADGAAAVQAYSGAVDSGHLRHQITFGRMSRECTAREDGSLAIKVGVDVRALLGPAGAPGTFDAPLTFATRYNGVVLSTHSRRLAVSVPAGAAQGVATAIDSELNVPADKAVGYEIVVALGGQAARAAPHVAAKRRKPAATEAAATTDVPAAAQ